uniref:Uncharacterized protein n=1 Tax=Ciona intestinalis TaxID=7719 RepID=H2Y2U2_CIOIN
MFFFVPSVYAKCLKQVISLYFTVLFKNKSQQSKRCSVLSIL